MTTKLHQRGSLKILVVDDEHSFGALLGHTLKRLGHKPVIAAHPEDALALLADDVDAVITDIDMPVMNGVELVRAIRARLPDMPVAFCTGSAPESQTVHEAQLLGRVLPKVWTVADVKSVVGELARACQPAASPRRRRRSSVASLYDAAAASPREAVTGTQPSVTASAPRPARRVRITFKAWRQLRKLVNEVDRGPVYVSVPGPVDIEPGVPVVVSLALPGEITVRVSGEVQAVRPRADGRPEVVLDLNGLDRETAARLRALADASDAEDRERDTGYLRVSRRATESPRLARGSDTPIGRVARDMRVSEIIRDNRRLRAQIDGLAASMTTTRKERDDD